MSDEKTDALEVRGPAPLATTVDAQGVLHAMQAVQQVLKECATEGEDYMRLPETTKDTMLQPLAEKLMLGARLVPEFKVEEIDLPNQHKRFKVTGHLLDDGGVIRGTGSASCSTMESKYRWRYVSAPCPTCKAEGAIIKGKKEYGGGWICWAKKGGCGAKFPDTMEFQTSKQENPDVADVWNTVEQMAIKRWLVSTVKRTLALSGMFTMDLEENPPAGGSEPRKPAPTARTGGKKKTQQKRQQAPPPAGNGGGGPPEPPADAYEEDAAAAASKGSAAKTVTKQDVEEMRKASEKAGVNFAQALRQAGWDGSPFDLPQGMVQAVYASIKDLRGKGGAS